MTTVTWFERLRQWARALKRDVIAVWLAARDPRTPATAKWLALWVAAYALSPIDLIPDFIPILGYLDDLILVPLGIALVVRMIPAPLMQEFRAQGEQIAARPVSRVAAACIIAGWAIAGLALGFWLVRR
jgi:uncharacterized membrane protein YkvA (DUF1232 family)